MSLCRKIEANSRPENSDARLKEASIVRLCLDGAASALAVKLTCQQAQTLRLAAMLLRSSHPEAFRNLQRAYDDHQREHGCTPPPPETAIEQGWIIGLARFRDTLSREMTGERPL